MQGKLPLVFLSGLLNTGRVWAAQTQELGGFCDVSVADLTVADTMQDLAVSVLQAAPSRFALAGLSMGGYVAFEILRQAPDRVDRLALVDTTPRPDAPDQSARRKDLVAMARAQGMGAVLPQLLPGFLSPTGAHNPELVEIVTQMATDVGVEAFARQQAAILGRPDSRRDLANIQCPTVVIVGAEDALTGGEIAQEMADGIPGAVLAEISDAATSRPWQTPTP